MKKLAVILMLSMALALDGCGSAGEDGLPAAADGNLPEAGISEIGAEEEPADDETEDDGSADDETYIQTEGTAGTNVVQGGPYGEISISLPDGWRFETYPVDSEDFIYGMYGVQFWPDSVSEGCVRIIYTDSFGVCGTGLAQETATVAERPARVGTYDNHEYWDFITFEGDYKGIVALTYLVDDWWSEYSSQVLEILDTVSFDQSMRESGIYVPDDESENVTERRHTYPAALQRCKLDVPLTAVGLLTCSKDNGKIILFRNKKQPLNGGDREQERDSWKRSWRYCQTRGCSLRC